MDFISQYSTNIFKRSTTTFNKPSSPSGATIRNASGSITSMGGAFVLLNAKVIGGNTPALLRLYSNQSSMILDQNRTPGDFNLNDAVSLISEISFDSSNLITFDPPVIGNTFTGGQLWYNLSGSLSNVVVQVTSYALRPENESLDGNISLVVSGSDIPTTGYGVSGSITTSKSFLILSGSANSESRLRLYSRPYTEIPLSEMTRSFDTQSQDGSLLIADLVFDSASFIYPLVPILEGFTWKETNYAVGNNQVGYILQNRSAGTSDITASLYIYSTED